MIQRAIFEFLFPWLRLRRLIRELDAEERVGIAMMKQEWWRRKSIETLADFHRPMLFTKFIR